MRPTWRNRVTLGKTLASADRTLSMRLTVVGLSLPYPHPLPDIEPEASNTSMASSVQGAEAQLLHAFCMGGARNNYGNWGEPNG